jgi:hypothetical protein
VGRGVRGGATTGAGTGAGTPLSPAPVPSNRGRESIVSDAAQFCARFISATPRSRVTARFNW